MARHEHAHEFLGFLVSAFTRNQHFAGVLVVKIADRALDQAAFLVHQAGSIRTQRQAAHVLPKPHQIFEIALDLCLGAAGAGSPQDDTHAVGNIQFRCNGFEPLAVR